MADVIKAETLHNISLYSATLSNGAAQIHIGFNPLREIISHKVSETLDGFAIHEVYFKVPHYRRHMWRSLLLRIAISKKNSQMSDIKDRLNHAEIELKKAHANVPLNISLNPLRLQGLLNLKVDTP